MLAATVHGYADGEDVLQFFKELKLRGTVEAALDRNTGATQTNGDVAMEEAFRSKTSEHEDGFVKASLYELYAWQLVETFKVFFSIWDVSRFENGGVKHFLYSGCHSVGSSKCRVPLTCENTVAPLELNCEQLSSCDLGSRGTTGWASIFEALHLIIFKSMAVDSLLVTSEVCGGNYKLGQHKCSYKMSAAADEELLSDTFSLSGTTDSSFTARPECNTHKFESTPIGGVHGPLGDPASLACTGRVVCECVGCSRATEAAADPGALLNAKRNSFRMLLTLGDVCSSFVKDSRSEFVGNRVRLLLRQLNNISIERRVAVALVAAWRKAGSRQRQESSNLPALEASLLKSCTHMFIIRCGALPLAAQLLVPLTAVHSASNLIPTRSQDTEGVDLGYFKAPQGNDASDALECFNVAHEVASSLIAVLESDRRIGGPICKALLKALNVFFSVVPMDDSFKGNAAQITCQQPLGKFSMEKLPDSTSTAQPVAGSKAFILRGVGAWHCLRSLVIALASTPHGADSLLDIILKPLGRNGDIPCRLPLVSALIDIFAGCCPMPLEHGTAVRIKQDKLPYEQAHEGGNCAFEESSRSLPLLGHTEGEKSFHQSSPTQEDRRSSVAPCLKGVYLERVGADKLVCLACGVGSSSETAERQLLSRLYMQFFRRALVMWADSNHMHSSSLEQQVALTFCICRCLHRVQHAASSASASFETLGCIPCASWASPQSDPASLKGLPLMGNWEIRHLLDGIHIRLNAFGEPVRCCALAAANGFAVAIACPRSDRRLEEMSPGESGAVEAWRASDNEGEMETSTEDAEVLLEHCPALRPLVLDAAGGWKVEGAESLWKAAAGGAKHFVREGPCENSVRANSGPPVLPLPAYEEKQEATLPSEKAFFEAMRSGFSPPVPAEDANNFKESEYENEVDGRCSAQSSRLRVNAADVDGTGTLRENRRCFTVDKLPVDIEESSDEDDPYFASLPRLKPLHGMQQVQFPSATGGDALLRERPDLENTLVADYGAFPAPPQSLLQVLEWLTNNMAITDLPAGTILTLTSPVRRPAEAGGRGENAAQRLYRLATATQTLTRLLIVQAQCSVQPVLTEERASGFVERVADYPLGSQLFQVLLSMDTSLDSALLEPLRASSLAALIAVFFRHLLLEVDAVLCKSEYTLGQKLLLLQTMQRAARWLQQGAPADGRALCADSFRPRSARQLGACKASQGHLIQSHIAAPQQLGSSRLPQHRQPLKHSGGPGEVGIPKPLSSLKDISSPRVRRFARPAQIRKGVVNLFSPLMAAVYLRLLSCLQLVPSPPSALTALEQQVLLRRRQEKERVLGEPLLVAGILITAAEVLRCGGAAADGDAKRLCCSRAVDLFLHFYSHRDKGIRRGAICVLSSAALLAPWDTVVPWLEEGDSTASGKAAFRRAPASFEYCPSLSFIGTTKCNNAADVLTGAWEDGVTLSGTMTRQSLTPIPDMSRELLNDCVTSLCVILGHLALEDSDAGCRRMAKKLLVNWFNRNEKSGCGD